MQNGRADKVMEWDDTASRKFKNMGTLYIIFINNTYTYGNIKQIWAGLVDWDKLGVIGN